MRGAAAPKGRRLRHELRQAAAAVCARVCSWRLPVQIHSGQPQPAVSPRYSNSLGAMDGLSSVLALRTKGAEVGEARHSDPVL